MERPNGIPMEIFRLLRVQSGISLVKMSGQIVLMIVYFLHPIINMSKTYGISAFCMIKHKKANVSNDQEMTQSEQKSHTKT